MEPSAAAAALSDTTSTPECDPLLKTAVPDVYRNNSFRILGLPVDTSLRDAAKEVNRRQMLAELGRPESGTHTRLEIRPAPTIDELRTAEAVLHDPAQRLVHELFWFWPLDPLSGQSDPALQAIKAGDLKRAAKFWDTARKDARTSAARVAIAKHNTAVRWHFQVLDLETTTEGKCWDDAQADNWRKTWVVALAYWNDSLHADAIWNALSARVIALNDERVSLEFVQSMRKTAGRALLKINAMLALRYVVLNASTAALAHASLLLDSPLCAENPSAVDEFLVAPLKESVRQRIRDTEAGRTNDRSQGKDIAHRLIAKFSSYLPLLNRLTAGREAYDLAGLFDEVVSECLSCAIAYYNATSDGPSSITLFETILPLARSEAVRTKVEENIATGKSNLLAEKLAPLHEPLTAIEESKEAPCNRLVEFILTIEPLVAKLGTMSSVAGPVQDLVSDRIAQLLRNISVDAWNTTKDDRTAFDALGRAEKFARSTDLKSQLATDRATLVRVYAAERRDKQAKKNKKYAWFAGVGALAVIVIALNVNDNSPPQEALQAAPPTSAPSLDTGSAPTADEKRTYSVPQYMTAELDRDRAAAETAQREAADLDTQLTAARKELESKQAAAREAKAALDDFRERLEGARLYVSSDDAAAAARFNKEVTKYNRMVAQVHQQIVAADALVDPYNALLARAKAKADEADRRVDAYNQKLAQVGH
jgi:hypothetical protein